MKETHRGIHTDSSPKNELKLKTITNRWGQLSLSLPRIDDKKRWAGYPGNTGISRKLARLIKPCITYAEPFSGTAKVAQELMKLKPKSYKKIYLNDTAPKIAAWLKKNFPKHNVTCKDYTKLVKQLDSKRTVFLFDPPWFRSYYDTVFSSFNRSNVAEYEEELLELCNTMKATFYITTRLESKRMQQSDFGTFTNRVRIPSGRKNSTSINNY